MQIQTNFLKIIVITTLLYESVQTACVPTIVKNIRALWNNKPPTGLLSKYSGSWTFVGLGMSDFDMNGLKCWKQVVKGTTATDYLFFKDVTENFSTKVTLHEDHENAGVLHQTEETEVKKTSKQDTKSTTKVDFNDEFHVVYMDHEVSAWYVCPQTEAAFSIISIRDIAKNKKKPATKKAVEEAKKRLKKAGIKMPIEVPTDCPVVKRSLTGKTHQSEASTSKKKQPKKKKSANSK